MNKALKRPQNAIATGPDTWIDHVEPAVPYRQAVAIDDLLADLAAMWAALETYCVAGCCGFDAFDFSADGVSASLSKVNAARTCEALATLRGNLLALRANAVSSNRLNMFCDKNEFLELLGHLDRCYRVAIPVGRDQR
ncbi:hypothetical protein INH39_29565 [Massilia violaceinigra]|uniref:Uncharacterized protein n=1 Tax=Massilia violaceinigra TaxID=2045208 RepID=A0ABY4A400_9BURK|nr:DUF6331 family protein [Massilia violaceinigra]UOD29495.1 hypothetical protein INH39_29565 [Massilia violaceinigra]